MMLRIIENTSSDRAKTYFSSADYYTEGQELVGVWRGEGAGRLGLEGNVGQRQWDALCENREPSSGRSLTPRQKADRRIGYDFNFHVPKSVSILYGLTRDDRILQAFRESVESTMEDIETEMQTRVRRSGRNEDRTTGNMVWGEFIHFTARPVDGVPDPHLHAHCFVFNTTWDALEDRWKAGQFAGIKRDGPFFEAVFHSRLGRRLEELGLPVERTKRGWEVSGVPQTAIRKFSRRTDLIEKAARDKGITNADAKGELGAKTREKKQKDVPFAALQQEWTGRLTPEELVAFRGLRSRIGHESIGEDDRATREAVSQAIGHVFERNSAVPERRFLAEALRRSIGSGSVSSVMDRVSREGLVSAEREGRRYVTTREVLAEERRMIDFARTGRGTCRRLGAGEHVFKRKKLTGEQRHAVLHVLGSRDRVIVIRGGAGTGKTTMMREAVEGIEANGRMVFTFAPSADASRGVLRDKEGFANANTVARLLADERMQAEVQGEVIWIDEAGLLGTRTMAEVFDLAGRLDARVVLSGDRRQHGSVERGAALRLLERQAGLVPAELREIQRQQDQYKAAVKALGDGRTKDGFRQLDDLKWIREVPDANRYEQLATAYVEAVTRDKSDDAALVVSPTHLEGEWITDDIRSRLKQSGLVGPGERQVAILTNSNLTEAERRDPVNYSAGDVLVFHQNAKGVRKGQRIVASGGPLPLQEAGKFQVFRSDILPVAPGDKLRITRNGRTADDRHELNNGTLVTVKGFAPNGDIRLTNGWTIAHDYGHLAHGYVITSHASQGRTVNHVFIGQSSQSFPASSREQFYVSVSRGRHSATIFTDHKEELLKAVDQSDERLAATELVTGDLVRERAEHQHRMQAVVPGISESGKEREGVNNER